MKFNHNEYTEVGVGETTALDMYLLTDNGPIPIPNHLVGQIILDSTPETYLRRVGSGIAKTEFPTGATRSDATGRGRFDLVPYEAMLSLARRYEMGAAHFGDRNWEKGQPLSRLLSSMRRHAHQIGYDYSEDHAGAVLWNAAAFETMVRRIEAGILPKELDDIGYFINREATK